MSRLVLASGSPRRRELLKLIAPSFQVVVPTTDETIAPGASPAQAVQELALRKARAVAKAYPNRLVVGADTVVALDGAILGKPGSPREAEDMLRALSGREHRVFTGVALCCRDIRPAGAVAFFEETAVRFEALTGQEIADYVRTGEPMDKAGAYGIQGGAAVFVSAIHGDYHNVVGLPVSRLYRELRRTLPHPEEWLR